MPSLRLLACTVASALLSLSVLAQSATAVERNGLRCVSSLPFPIPAGSKGIAECDLQATGGKLPPGWGSGNGEILPADESPDGRPYFRFKAKKNAGYRSPVITAQPGVPYFLSYWIKTSAEPWTTITFASEEREPTFTNIHTPFAYADFPLDTGGRWRQEGFYFMMPPQCKTLQFNTNPRADGADGETYSIGGIRLRTATEGEMATAYQAERAHLPPYDVASRPGDGRCLALSIAKWEGRAGIPGKPFVIWALGSSYTDRQGDGYELIQEIRRRYPHAPPIIYRKHGGPGTPWEFVAAWIKQFIATEQPDLIFTYTNGTLEGLDNLLTEVRHRTTADIIVPSLHFNRPESPMTPEDIETGTGVDWQKVRELCQKHGAEFVENRREMADYLAKNRLAPDDLLADHNHQNLHGRIRIWDNVGRHLGQSGAPALASPSSNSDLRSPNPERRIPVTPSAALTATDSVTLSGSWNPAQDGAIQSTTAGTRLKVAFTGNQIDLTGRRSTNGGTVKILIDGVPADQTPAFVMNCIQPSQKHAWKIPHAVDLDSAKAVPQTWTITMTSNSGDYRLEGSVTGPDGTGNLAQPFRSSSGQIGLDPKSWRGGRIEKPGQPVEYGVAEGDAFTFDVARATAGGELSFKAVDAPSDAPLWVISLARNLPNTTHTLELISTDAGEIRIEALYVHEPPEKSP